jgi:hypothetical protein
MMRQNWEPLFRDHASQKSLRSSIDLVREAAAIYRRAAGELKPSRAVRIDATTSALGQLTTAGKAAPAQ